MPLDLVFWPSSATYSSSLPLLSDSSEGERGGGGGAGLEGGRGVVLINTVTAGFFGGFDILGTIVSTSLPPSSRASGPSHTTKNIRENHIVSQRFAPNRE